MLNRGVPRPAGPHTVEIVVAHGYHPNFVKVPAGRPIRLVFRREDDEPCADRVVFSAPHLERRLAPNGVTVIDLPAVSGEVRFTCARGRYRGRIRALPAGAVDTFPGTATGLGVVAAVATALLILLGLATSSGSAEALALGIALLLGDLAALAFLILRTAQLRLAPGGSRSPRE